MQKTQILEGKQNKLKSHLLLEILAIIDPFAGRKAYN